MEPRRGFRHPVCMLQRGDFSLMHSMRLTFAAGVVLGAMLPSAAAGDWPQWRGPLGTGQSDEKSAPLTWSPTEHVKWKVPLDGPGNSTPIVIGDNVFITHSPASSSRRGIHCYDRHTGDLRWKHEVEYSGQE